jgi:sugar/nucleoside kinase (ribokinase family)
MSILVIGSVALDTVETPFGKRRDILGGSATFFSIAARLFNDVHIVACVGEDFPKKYIDIFRKKRIGLSGLETSRGKTFRWEGRYSFDLNTAHTLATRLNVFRDFVPKIPRELRSSEYLFLANIDPVLQDSVLGQVRRPRLVGCDTMNHWIAEKPAELKRLVRKVDMLFLNDAEARQFSQAANLIKAAKAVIAMGPKIVVIKKGEHGVLLYSRNSHFMAPAYPLDTVFDPTGAGDSFAGGMMGYLSRSRKINDRALRRSVIYGTIIASFAVEDFSVNRLIRLKKSDIEARYRRFRALTRF